ncbi:hypothetical protein V9J15_04260 [Candidatus Liberibacter africanus]|uniref:hypothetical protein n=1 Tax=Liberibacter africanus TaxID=34020 RepID=UPI00339D4579
MLNLLYWRLVMNSKDIKLVVLGTVLTSSVFLGSCDLLGKKNNSDKDSEKARLTEIANLEAEIANIDALEAAIKIAKQQQGTKTDPFWAKLRESAVNSRKELKTE